MISSFLNNEINFVLDNRDKNIRDVLAHLHEWHLMMISWYKDGSSGIKPNMPVKNYTWKETKELNKEIQNNYQSFSYDEVKELFIISYLEIQDLIINHTNEELFTKKYYKWTNTTSLSSYLISSSSSHYDWAIKLLKKEKKALKLNE